jgi:hypothetical protein
VRLAAAGVITELEGVEGRADLVRGAIDGLFALGLDGADARVQFLQGRLEALTGEAEALGVTLEGRLRATKILADTLTEQVRLDQLDPRAAADQVRTLLEGVQQEISDFGAILPSDSPERLADFLALSETEAVLRSTLVGILADVPTFFETAFGTAGRIITQFTASSASTLERLGRTASGSIFAGLLEQGTAVQQTLAPFRTELEQVDNRIAQFGETDELAASKLDILRRAALAMIDAGLDPMSQSVVDLSDGVEALGEEFGVTTLRLDEAAAAAGRFLGAFDQRSGLERLLNNLGVPINATNILVGFGKAAAEGFVDFEQAVSATDAALSPLLDRLDFSELAPTDLTRRFELLQGIIGTLTESELSSLRVALREIRDETRDGPLAALIDPLIENAGAAAAFFQSTRDAYTEYQNLRLRGVEILQRREDRAAQATAEAFLEFQDSRLAAAEIFRRQQAQAITDAQAREIAVLEERYGTEERLALATRQALLKGASPRPIAIPAITGVALDPSETAEALLTLEGLKVALSQVDLQARVFGETTSTLTARTQLYRGAIEALLAGGLDPESNKIQGLFIEYEKYAGKLAEVQAAEQARTQAQQLATTTLEQLLIATGEAPTKVDAFRAAIDKLAESGTVSNEELEELLRLLGLLQQQDAISLALDTAGIAVGVASAIEAGISQVEAGNLEGAISSFFQAGAGIASLAGNDLVAGMLGIAGPFVAQISQRISDAFTGDSAAQRALRATLSSTIAGAFVEGMLEGANQTEGWREALGENVRDVLLRSIFEAFVQSAIIESIIQPFLRDFARVMETEGAASAARFAAANFDAIFQRALGSAETFLGALPPNLLPAPASGGLPFNPDRSDATPVPRERPVSLIAERVPEYGAFGQHLERASRNIATAMHDARAVTDRLADDGIRVRSEVEIRGGPSFSTAIRTT